METPPHDSSPAIETVADAPLPDARRLPLRFTWRMDHDGRFALGAEEFIRLVGPRTTAGFGRPWSEIAETFGLDPDGRVMQAFATRETWSGIMLNWPVDGGGRLPVELSGLPFFDAARNFVGYRGFGVCRDIDGLARLAALRRDELFGEAAAPKKHPPRIHPTTPASRHLRLRNCLLQSPPRLHIKPIWKRPWKPPRTI